MGLLSIIRKIKKKEKEMRILMVGLDNSGKTTIVLRINGEDTSVISPTLGFNIRTINYQKYASSSHVLSQFFWFPSIVA
ncbi:Adp-ribosylation factor-like protein [Thalictrum thalictroides]|uniref:Adp-ribosylation factor-like protein n=1 Tax=Thalictrum thalictroides TaxID=46969 RepID=A0A7J6UVR7_THATH|nr:Adp-ribosylation factor-like protein [Thalictrum thalictroides]